MNLSPARVLMCLSLLVTAVCVDAAPTTPTSDEYNIAILLDPRATKADRLAEAHKVTAAAQRRNARAQYVLGALYRLGEDHPAALFQRDEAQAAKYLSNAAIGGEILAMAGMAELELLRGRLLPALVWAEVYEHYDAVAATLRQRSSWTHDRRAYVAFLLVRCRDAVAAAGADPDGTVMSHVTAFTGRHDSAIRNAITENARQAALLDDHLRFLRWADSVFSAQRLIDPGLSIFHIAVAADGRIVDHQVVDSLPNHLHANALHRWLRSARFNRTQSTAATELRWAIWPITRDTLNYAIKARE